LITPAEILTTMEALLVEDFGSARVDSVSNPEVGPGDLLVSVDRVQISVTECSLFRGAEGMAADLIRERLGDGDNRLFGHEFCGTVEDIGDAVRGFDVGDRVYAPGKITCGSCPYCQIGYESLCENYQTLGTHRPGALAEQVVAPATIFRTLPDEVTDAEGAALQPLADVTNTVADVGITPGDSVAILGTGVMGYYCGQVALARGAGEVFAIDIDPRKVDLATNRGMVGIHPGETDPVDVVTEATGGRGADIVVEAVGGSQSTAISGSDPIAQAFSMVRRAGTIVQMGIIEGEITLEPRQFRSKSVRWLNPKIGIERPSPNRDTGELAVELVASGRVSIEEFITHELKGISAFERAVDITLNQVAHDALGPAQLII